MFSTLSLWKNLLVCFRNLTPSREPHALMLLNMSDCLLKVFDPQGLSNQERMKRNSHEARNLIALLIERVELNNHRSEVVFAGVALPNEQAQVIKLHAIRNREQLPRFHLHAIGLVIIVPITHVGDTLLRQNIRRIKGLG